MQKIKIFGIPNCDTTRKAIQWFKERGLSTEFHDFKTQGIHCNQLKKWCASSDWELILNRKSTTWKSLYTQEQCMVTDESSAMEMMLKYPNLIKRPVVEINETLICVGFREVTFEKELEKNSLK